MQDRILSNAQQGKESSILVLQMQDNNLSREIGHVGMGADTDICGGVLAAIDPAQQCRQQRSEFV